MRVGLFRDFSLQPIGTARSVLFRFCHQDIARDAGRSSKLGRTGFDEGSRRGDLPAHFERSGRVGGWVGHLDVTSCAASVVHFGGIKGGRCHGGNLGSYVRHGDSGDGEYKIVCLLSVTGDAVGALLVGFFGAA